VGQVLLVDGGDTIIDPKASEVIDSRQITEVAHALAAMRYDAIAAGEGELLADRLPGNDWAGVVGAPVLGANLRDREGRPPHVPCVSKSVGGVRVVVIGALSPQVASAATSAGSVAQVDPIGVSLGRLLEQVRPEADLVVLLLHGTLDEGRELAAELEGIDVIVVGHHGLLAGPSTTVGGTLLVQVGSEGKYVGRLKLRVDETGQAALLEEEQVLMTQDIPEDPTVASLLELGSR